MSKFAELVGKDSSIDYEFRNSNPTIFVQRYRILHKTKKARESLRKEIDAYECNSAEDIVDLLSNCLSMYPPTGTYKKIEKIESIQRIISGVGVVFWTSAMISNGTKIDIDPAYFKYKDIPYKYMVQKYAISVMCNTKTNDIDIAAQLFYNDTRNRIGRYNISVKNFDCSALNLQEDNMRIYLIDLLQAILTYTARSFLYDMLERSERMELQ